MRIEVQARIEQSKLRRRQTQYLPMTAEESWTFVKEHYKMILCTLDSRGLPHAAPVWYIMMDEKIYFRAQPYKKKMSNILRNPQVCAVVEDGDKYTELRGVMIQGMAKNVDTNKSLRKEVFAMLAEKYKKLRDTELFPTHWQEKFGKEHRVVVEVTPTNIVSWDNRKWVGEKSGGT